MSVNEAKEKYVDKSVEKEVTDRCEISLEANIVPSKEESSNIDALADDDENACQAKADEEDLATVFCEVFIPDCDSRMQDMCDETPKRKNCKRKTKSAKALPTRDSIVTRRKLERTNVGDKFSSQNSAKLSSDSLNADLVCEFCGKLLPSFDEAQIHYVKEHSNADCNSKGREKRIKR